MENKFIVSSSPHIRSNEDTSYIMKQVVIALVPAALAAVYYFRASAIFVMFFVYWVQLDQNLYGKR